MRNALRSVRSVPMCSQTGFRLAVFLAGWAERSKRAEGKIKETGTMRWRFRGKPLSAHCFGEPRAAPWFWPPRAACLLKAFALEGFDWHHSPKSGGIPCSRPEAHL